MFKSVFAVFLVLLLSGCGDDHKKENSTQEVTKPEVATKVVEKSVGEIVLSDEPKTEAEKAADLKTQLADLETKARKKDYKAQRNLAYMLGGGQLVGHREATDEQKISACAWRLVIIKSGSEEVNAGDEENFAMDCNKLADPQKDKAADEAVKILKDVYGM
ncbi:hypothetical protein [Thiothrix sp.]|uniref:hypothetical protein n=1 Tax=Thiothrix sp. TaxID=1032 RepID=UPI00257A192D|nr:hypothetical protein [Thiothrix sp.]